MHNPSVDERVGAEEMAFAAQVHAGVRRAGYDAVEAWTRLSDVVPNWGVQAARYGVTVEALERVARVWARKDGGVDGA